MASREGQSRVMPATAKILEYDGKLMKIPPRRVVPKPIQKPHPPMWLAGTNPQTFTLAGQKGLGMLGSLRWSSNSEPPFAAKVLLGL